MAIVGPGGSSDWRKGERDEWKQAGGTQAGYKDFIRKVDTEKGPSGNWAGNKENDDTRQAINAARSEMKANGIKGDVATYMAKQMENENRAANGLKPLPDPQASMNQASGAWPSPAARGPAPAPEQQRPAPSAYAKARFGME